MKIVRSANIPDAEKSMNLKETELHLILAKQERAVYNNECVKVAEELKLNPVSPKLAHFSFDYAQQVHYPSSPQQVGPLYFLAHRKCQIFGVCNEGKAEQGNYLIDEDDYVGNGANCVVSMVHTSLPGV